MEAASKIIKLKLRGKVKYTKVDDMDETNNVIWSLGNLEDIMVNFKEVKQKPVAIDNHEENNETKAE